MLPGSPCRPAMPSRCHVTMRRPAASHWSRSPSQRQGSSRQSRQESADEQLEGGDMADLDWHAERSDLSSLAL